MASAVTCLPPWCRRGVSSKQINLGISLQLRCPRELRQAVNSCAAGGTISTGNKGVDRRFALLCRGQRVMREAEWMGWTAEEEKHRWSADTASYENHQLRWRRAQQSKALANTGRLGIVFSGASIGQGPAHCLSQFAWAGSQTWPCAS